MKVMEELDSFRAMDLAGINAKVAEVEEELMNLRFRHASGQLEQTAQLKLLKRKIARLKTLGVEAERASKLKQ